MGNLQANGSVELLDGYRQVRKENNGTVITGKGQEETFFLKEFSYTDKKQYQRQLKRYKQLEQNQENENLLSLVKLSSREFNNFCSNSYKIYAVYQYPSITLQEEIAARKKEDKYFEECQLWSILQSCANALSQIKSSISLHPKNVFIVPDGVLKVVNNDMITEDYRCFIKEGVYYAPQKIRQFHRTDNESTLRKQSIFSLGMTLLHTALLRPVDDCYNYQKFEFCDSRLEENIEELLGANNDMGNSRNKRMQYSEDFIEMLAMIIEPNPNKRASLMEVHGMLNRIWNTETEENQPITKVPEQQSQPFKSRKFEEREVQNHKLIDEQLLQKYQPNISSKPTHDHIIDTRSYLPSLTQSHKNSQSSVTLQKIDIESKYRNVQPTTYINKENLFTDPMLLEMIRKDLHDLGEMKRSSTFKSYTNATYVSQVPHHSYSIISGFSSNELKEPNFQKKGNKGAFVVEEYEDGRKFEGIVANGLKQGHGKLTYSDGAYYQGQFINDKMEGEGTLFYGPNRPAYQGEWKADQFHGYGVLFNENPQNLNQYFNYNDFNLIQDYWVRYEGYFDSDNKSGEGKLILSNGEEFHGHFENDFVNGRGSFLTNDQEQVTGIWEDNILVEMDA